MAQIALISDIHGNIPALEAVLRDIQRRGIETIYCLGDLIGKGPHGDVAVDMVRTHCQQVIKGIGTTLLAMRPMIHRCYGISIDSEARGCNILPASLMS